MTAHRTLKNRAPLHLHVTRVTTKKVFMPNLWNNSKRKGIEGWGQKKKPSSKVAGGMPHGENVGVPFTSSGV